jgi:hypothetical protein
LPCLCWRELAKKAAAERWEDAGRRHDDGSYYLSFKDKKMEFTDEKYSI